MPCVSCADDAARREARGGGGRPPDADASEDAIWVCALRVVALAFSRFAWFQVACLRSPILREAVLSAALPSACSAVDRAVVRPSRDVPGLDAVEPRVPARARRVLRAAALHTAACAAAARGRGRGEEGEVGAGASSDASLGGVAETKAAETEAAETEAAETEAAETEAAETEAAETEAAETEAAETEAAGEAAEIEAAGEAAQTEAAGEAAETAARRSKEGTVALPAGPAGLPLPPAPLLPRRSAPPSRTPPLPSLPHLFSALVALFCAVVLAFPVAALSCMALVPSLALLLPLPLPAGVATRLREASDALSAAADGLKRVGRGGRGQDRRGEGGAGAGDLADGGDAAEARGDAPDGRPALPRAGSSPPPPLAQEFEATAGVPIDAAPGAAAAGAAPLASGPGSPPLPRSQRRQRRPHTERSIDRSVESQSASPESPAPESARAAPSCPSAAYPLAPVSRLLVATEAPSRREARQAASAAVLALARETDAEILVVTPALLDAVSAGLVGGAPRGAPLASYAGRLAAAFAAAPPLWAPAAWPGTRSPATARLTWTLLRLALEERQRRRDGGTRARGRSAPRRSSAPSASAAAPDAHPCVVLHVPEGVLGPLATPADRRALFEGLFRADEGAGADGDGSSTDEQAPAAPLPTEVLADAEQSLGLLARALCSPWACALYERALVACASDREDGGQGGVPEAAEDGPADAELVTIEPSRLEPSTRLDVFQAPQTQLDASQDHQAASPSADDLAPASPAAVAGLASASLAAIAGLASSSSLSLVATRQALASLLGFLRETDVERARVSAAARTERAQSWRGMLIARQRAPAEPDAPTRSTSPSPPERPAAAAPSAPSSADASPPPAAPSRACSLPAGVLVVTDAWTEDLVALPPSAFRDGLAAEDDAADEGDGAGGGGDAAGGDGRGDGAASGGPNLDDDSLEMELDRLLADLAAAVDVDADSYDGPAGPAKRGGRGQGKGDDGKGGGKDAPRAGAKRDWRDALGSKLRKDADAPGAGGGAAGAAAGGGASATAGPARPAGEGGAWTPLPSPSSLFAWLIAVVSSFIAAPVRLLVRLSSPRGFPASATLARVSSLLVSLLASLPLPAALLPGFASAAMVESDPEIQELEAQLATLEAALGAADQASGSEDEGADGADMDLPAGLGGLWSRALTDMDGVGAMDLIRALGPAAALSFFASNLLSLAASVPSALFWIGANSADRTLCAVERVVGGVSAALVTLFRAGGADVAALLGTARGDDGRSALSAGAVGGRDAQRAPPPSSGAAASQDGDAGALTSPFVLPTLLSSLLWSLPGLAGVRPAFPPPACSPDAAADSLRPSPRPSSPAPSIPALFPTLASLRPPKGARGADQAARRAERARRELAQANRRRAEAAAGAAGVAIGADVPDAFFELGGYALSDEGWARAVSWAVGRQLAESVVGAKAEEDDEEASGHATADKNTVKGAVVSADKSEFVDAMVSADEGKSTTAMGSANERATRGASKENAAAVPAPGALEPWADAAPGPDDAPASASRPSPPTLQLSRLSIEYGVAMLDPPPAPLSHASTVPLGTPIEASNKHEEQLLPRLVEPEDLGVGFGDVGALKDAKRALREAVSLPLRDPDLLVAAGIAAGGAAGGDAAWDDALEGGEGEAGGAATDAGMTSGAGAGGKEGGKGATPSGAPSGASPPAPVAAAATAPLPGAGGFPGAAEARDSAMSAAASLSADAQRRSAQFTASLSVPFDAPPSADASAPPPSASGAAPSASAASPSPPPASALPPLPEEAPRTRPASFSLPRSRPRVPRRRLGPSPASSLLPTGVLLFGPPGTGKTLLARAAARDAGVRMLAVTPADLTSKWVGEGVRAVRATFSLAVAAAPCVIFLDEADALLGARGGGDENDASRELKNEFLASWDGIPALQGGGVAKRGEGDREDGKGKGGEGKGEEAGARRGRPASPLDEPEVLDEHGYAAGAHVFEPTAEGAREEEAGAGDEGADGAKEDQRGGGGAERTSTDASGTAGAISPGAAAVASNGLGASGQPTLPAPEWDVAQLPSTARRPYSSLFTPGLPAWALAGEASASAASPSSNGQPAPARVPPPVLVIAATNRPQDLDAAVIRRFSHRVPVPLPDAASRARILRVLLRGRSADASVDVDAVAAKTDGFSGADLARLVAEAVMRTVREAMAARRRARRAARRDGRGEGWGGGLGGGMGLDDLSSDEEEEDDEEDEEDDEEDREGEEGEGGDGGAKGAGRGRRGAKGAMARGASTLPNARASASGGGAKDAPEKAATSVRFSSSPASGPRPPAVPAPLSHAPSPLHALASRLELPSRPARPRPISERDLERALKTVGPSVAKDGPEAMALQEWERRFSTLGGGDRGRWTDARLSYYV